MNLFCHLSRLDIKTILVPANTFMILCSLERPAAGTATFVLQAPSSTRLYLCCMRRIKVASLTQIVWLVPGNKIHRFHFLVQTRQLDTFERNVNVFFFKFCMYARHSFSHLHETIYNSYLCSPNQLLLCSNAACAFSAYNRREVLLKSCHAVILLCSLEGFEPLT